MQKKLPTHAMERLLKVSGADRVSESSKEELNNVLRKRAQTISSKAIMFSKHRGRKTVKREDVLLAIEN